jgi:hypothetical protein
MNEWGVGSGEWGVVRQSKDGFAVRKDFAAEGRSFLTTHHSPLITRNSERVKIWLAWVLM